MLFFYSISFSWAKSFFPTVRTPKIAVISHMNRKERLKKCGIKRSSAFGANIFFRGDPLSCNTKDDHRKERHGNRDHPPRYIKIHIKPIHTAGCQKTDGGQKHGKQADSLFHRVSPLIFPHKQTTDHRSSHRETQK